MKTLSDLDCSGKRVLVRVDYNVPMREDGTIEDDTRIKETVPTLQSLLKRGAAVILFSHLGRPKGKRDQKYSLRPIAARLEKYLGKKVLFVDDCIGDEVKKVILNLKPGDVALLENLRFHAEEEKNNPEFAASLASLGQIFVEDAFGVVHRAHASTVGVPKLLPSAAGLLLDEEIKIFSALLSNPLHPYLAVLGGSKISDKLQIIKNLLQKVDAILIGGGMAFTFLKAGGIDVGNSIVDQAYLETAKKILSENPEKIILPVDCKAAPSLQTPSPVSVVRFGNSPMTGLQGLDIGPETIQRFNQFIKEKAPQTIFSNGPMGVFELPAFAEGTREVVLTLSRCAKSGTRVIFGGGDMVAAFSKFGQPEPNVHLSTGGGAALEFLEGKTLPGIAALCETAIR